MAAVVDPFIRPFEQGVGVEHGTEQDDGLLVLVPVPIRVICARFSSFDVEVCLPGNVMLTLSCVFPEVLPCGRRGNCLCRNSRRLTNGMVEWKEEGTYAPKQ